MTDLPSKDHPNCQKCKLHEGCKTPFMEPYGSDDAPIMIIGEAPGAEEDEQGIPFVGASGQKLRSVLEALEIPEEDVIYTNTVRCRPPNNKIHKRYINYCQQFMLDEIEQYNPKVVLLMGNSPLGAVLGESGITTWNGVIVEREDRAYIPLFHPAYILRNDHVEEEWLEGFIKMDDILADDYDSETHIKLMYPKTVGDVADMLDVLSTADVVSFDTETSTLDQHSDAAMILACSFAHIDSKGLTWSYAFPLDHPESWWDDDEYYEIVDMICEWFDNFQGVTVGHNYKFDWKVVKRFFDYEIRTGRDTILMSHMLTSRPDGHGLKRLSGLYLSMYDYDKPLRDYTYEHPECNVYKGGSYAFVPLEILLPYAALDTAATVKLDAVLWPQLTEQQQYFHEELLMRASDAVADMEYNGIKLDDYIVERYHMIYTTVRDRIYQEMMCDPDVAQLIEDKQLESDYAVLADALNIDTKSRGWMKDIAILKDHWTVEDGTVVIDKDILPPRKKNIRKRNVYEFNPNSDFHVRDLLFEYKGIDISTVEITETGLPSVSAGSLAQHRHTFPIVEQLRY